MFIKDSYLLTASHTFDVENMQEVTINIALNKAQPCYYTLLTGRVFHRKRPIKGAVVQVYDDKYKPLFHTVTNCKGVYYFNNVLTPGRYKVVVFAAGYQTSRVKRIKVRKRKVIKASFHLKRCPFFTNGIIYGYVREVKSKDSIEGATIYLRDKRGLVYKTTSNKEGQYIIYNIRPNQYKLTVMKKGYVSLKSVEITVEKYDKIRYQINIYKRK